MDQIQMDQIQDTNDIIQQIILKTIYIQKIKQYKSVIDDIDNNIEIFFKMNKNMKSLEISLKTMKNKENIDILNNINEKLENMDVLEPTLNI